MWYRVAATGHTQDSVAQNELPAVVLVLQADARSSADTYPVAHNVSS